MDSNNDFRLAVPPSDDEDCLQLSAVEDNDLIVLSPQKRQRLYQPGKRTKRRTTYQLVPAPTSGNSEDSPVTVPDLEFEGAGSWNDSEHSGPGMNDSLPLATADATASDVPEVGSSHEYDEYVDCVMAGAAGFFQLETDLFVVQGWDTNRSATKTAQWYHLQKIIVGCEQSVVCFCPQNKLSQHCFHVRFLNEYGAQQFPDSTVGPEKKHRPVIIFLWEADDSLSRHAFSVSADQRRDSVKARVVIHHVGSEKGGGSWTCSKDGREMCGHINRAKNYLLQATNGEPAGTLTSESDKEEVQVLPEIARSPRGQSCISHLPILPPIWAALPRDQVLYDRPPALRRPPNVIQLDLDARCLCDSRVKLDVQSICLPCKVYTLAEAFNCEIEVQVCPESCSRGVSKRYVGADGRSIGLFNYNNKILFAHDLLDDYTMAYTSSETPFVAWVSVVERRYLTFSANASFVSEDIFRNAWFLYARLQNYEHDMECPTCGPEPVTVIFDGVTLAYGKKHLTSSLQPPTTITTASVRQPSRYVYGQAFLGNEIRKLVRKVVTGRSLVLSEKEQKISQELGSSAPANDSGEEEEFEDISKQSTSSRLRTIREVIDRIEAIPSARSGLQEISPSLGELFGKYCGVERLMAQIATPQEYVAFFKELSAQESVLQMIPLPSLAALNKFIQNPTPANATLLRCIPALFNIVRYEESWASDRSTGYPSAVLDVCKWMAKRALDVLQGLRTHKPPPCDESIIQQTQDWLTTGSLYNMPKIRHRPEYPNLKHDQNVDGGKQRAKCSKYFAEYGENRLTGGIMVCWCTHNVAYGFHCIPKGEGRNDVFSALLTHWKVAPKWVVYDFACALAPYCMTREADFFKNTRFGIDDCHALGHTKCGPSCFIKTYGDLDPQIARINTSAAECGNGGISRIRKSVIYMREDRAIIYTRVFLAIWNRLKIRRILKQSGI